MTWRILFNDKCVNDLEECLRKGPIIEYQGQEHRSLNEEYVGSIGGLKISIYANEHPPPHFHVEYNGESNSFSILDGSPMYPKDLKKYFRNINKWFIKNRVKLIDAWNRNRPANCPIGAIQV